MFRSIIILNKQKSLLLLLNNNSKNIIGSYIKNTTPTCCAGIRYYRGEANDGQSIISEAEQILYERAKPRSTDIYNKHISLPKIKDIPKSSLSLNEFNKTSDNYNINDIELNIRRKRLIYRSKQRGWLEVDILLGTWANLYVNTLNINELYEYETFVNYETIDIYI